LAETCTLWEKEALNLMGSGVRTVLLRIGVVLEKGGGALSKMIPPFQFFIGGPLGSGTQWVPWIHREDIINIMFFILSNQELEGPINGTAPNAVTMRGLCSELGKALKRPSWAPVPAFMLKLLLGEMSELLLAGQKAVPEKLIRHGYLFQYPKVDQALSAIL